jgi:protein SCO1
MKGDINKGGFTLFALLALSLVCVLALGACRKGAEAPVDEPGSYVANNPADCLPDITLVDQYGKPVPLASLKGKLVLIDFIYTSCPGPCETMTAKMARVADQLKTRLGSQVTMVSVTLDPEHDRPQQMLAFAKAQGAERKGWLFLTGDLHQVEQLLAPYHIRRVREANGTIDHVLEMFLLGPDGRQLRLYAATSVKPQTVVADINRVLARPSS